MPKIAFSDVKLRSLQPPETGQTDYWDTSTAGFGFRLSQGGSKTFLLKHRNRRITIGRFPVLSLSQARTEAKRLLAEFTLGRVRPQALPFPAAVKLFLEEKRKNRRQRTTGDYERLLSRVGYMGPLSELTHDEVARLLKKITAPSEYNHILVALRVFCNWAVKRRYIEHNPTIGLSTHATVSRSRVLEDHEIIAIWKATEEPKIFNSIVRLALLTGQRVGEISKIQTSWISYNQKHVSGSSSGSVSAGSSDQFSQSYSNVDLCTLTFPAEVTKNGREHILPLSNLSTSLLTSWLTTQASKSELLFVARGKPTTSFNGWSKSKAALDKASGVKDWTLHDLRRTYATNMARLGVAPHVIEALLNHKSGIISGVAAIYNRHQFLPEMREAVEKYDSWLTDVLRLSGTQIAAQ